MIDRDQAFFHPYTSTVHLYSNPKHTNRSAPLGLTTRVCSPFTCRFLNGCASSRSLIGWFVARFGVRNGASTHITKGISLIEKPTTHTFIIVRQHNFLRIMNPDVYGIRRRRKHQGNTPSPALHYDRFGQILFGFWVVPVN